jgi:hypothetical protein
MYELEAFIHAKLNGWMHLMTNQREFADTYQANSSFTS